MIHYWHPIKRTLIPGTVLTLGLILTLAAQGQASGGSGTFATTGSMNFPRRGHLAVLLNSGEVLVVTGVVGDPGFNFNSAELYNPTTGKWTLTGSTSALHDTGTATLLSNGEVLLAGGGSGNPDSNRCTALAELYDPKTGRWADTGAMNSARCAPAAALLPNGEVLVAGGDDINGNSLATAELYSPVTGTWQETGSLKTSRIGPLVELLGNGTVLVAGGTNVTGSVSGVCALSAGCTFSRLTSAEIFNPSQGSWAPTGSMPASTGPGSLLANGDVLKFFNSFYNPATRGWTSAGKYPLGVTGGSTATLLRTGFVLATGFISTYNANPPLNAAYLYSSNTNTYASTGRMTTNRAQNTATLLPNGQVLISGGHNSQNSALSSAEVYTP